VVCIQCLDSFQFDQNGVLDRQVGGVCANNRAMVTQRDIMLLSNFVKFKSQRTIVDFLKKPTRSVFETTNTLPITGLEIRSGLSAFIRGSKMVLSANHSATQIVPTIFTRARRWISACAITGTLIRIRSTMQCT